MTFKQIRDKEINKIKQVDNINPVLYRVALLNSSFNETEAKEFETLEEAQAYFKELSRSIHPAFISKYAVINI